MKITKASLLLVLLGFASTLVAENMSNPEVVLETSHGDIVIELFEEQAPVTVENFLNLVDTKFYDGLVFHRVIKGFMIQGGGHHQDMKEKAADKEIINESSNGLQNETGTISMARRGDPHSASAQFFINTNDNASLDYNHETDTFGYAVFGKVVEGMEVVRAIEDLPTGSHGMHQNVPDDLPEIVSAKKREVTASD